MEMAQAEQELFRTQANRMNALYELVLAKADLDKALGKLYFSTFDSRDDRCMW